MKTPTRCPLRCPVHYQVQPVEFSKISVRRELRHHAIGGTERHSGNGKSIDLNGVILLSQIFNFTTDIDGPSGNPGVDLPYVLALPTYAATAWYHKKLPQQPAGLEPFLKEVEDFAMGRTLMPSRSGPTSPPKKNKRPREASCVHGTACHLPATRQSARQRRRV